MFSVSSVTVAFRGSGAWALTPLVASMKMSTGESAASENLDMAVVLLIKLVMATNSSTTTIRGSNPALLTAMMSQQIA
jgi:hypothetical protein